MTRKARAKTAKTNTGKKEPPTTRKDWRDRLRDGVNALGAGVVKVGKWLSPPLIRLRDGWNGLPPRRRKAVFAALWTVGVAFGIYSAWFARVHNTTAPVLRWGRLRVEAQFGLLLLLALTFIPLTALMRYAADWRDKKALPRLQSLSLPRRLLDHLVSPLAQARWLYLRHQDTRALERTQSLLAQEPNNAAARELLALIEKRIEEQPLDAQKAPVRPGRADSLLDSKLPSIAARVVAGSMLCLFLYGSCYYARAGFLQGWQAVAWTGHDKQGNPTQTSVLATMIECFVGAVLCIVYLVYSEGVPDTAAVWKKFKAGKSTKQKRPGENPLESKS